MNELTAVLIGLGSLSPILALAIAIEIDCFRKERLQRQTK